MKVVVVGEKLENHMFKIIQAITAIGCEFVFFKKFSALDIADVLIIESSDVSSVPCDIENHVITVVDEINYMSVFVNEYVINYASLSTIKDIISKIKQQYVSYIAVDHKTQDMFSRAKIIANSNASVLITGESGTGKEVLARYIHENSNRRNKKYVAVNCAAIPDGVLESEMFGHEKGAFTNAIQRRIGKFEEAHCGTILLDEIGEMPLLLQAKLLRVLQEKEITRIGSNDTISVDVRVIATTNKDLKKLIQAGEFREDLYFRLNVIPIYAHSLRSRKRDIAPLAEFFCEKYAHGCKKLTKTAIDSVVAHDWRGNIRELENIIYRSVVLTENNSIEKIEFDVFDDNIELKSLKDVEREAILGTISYTQGNTQKAAKILGITDKTLRIKLKEYTYAVAA